MGPFLLYIYFFSYAPGVLREAFNASGYPWKSSELRTRRSTPSRVSICAEVQGDERRLVGDGFMFFQGHGWDKHL